MNGILASLAIILVSFGTSYEDNRQATIVAVEKDVKEAFPDAYVASAYTSTKIRNKLKKNGIDIFSVNEAIEDALNSGCKNVIIQPTHLMYGLEYNEMLELANPYKEKFDSFVYGEPLLANKNDISRVESILSRNIKDKKTALVLMGHGTEHSANFLYAAADYQAKAEGRSNIFVGTVESYPDCQTVIKLVQEAGFKNVLITPLMLVAGDHANNDMAGKDSDSWKNQFAKAKKIKKVDTLVKGLGEYPAVRRMYIDKIAKAGKIQPKINTIDAK